MSVFLNHPPKLCFRKPVLVRSSSTPSLRQSPPCFILGARRERKSDWGKLVIRNGNEPDFTYLDKKVPMDLVDNDLYHPMVTIGASHGWIATLNYVGGSLALHDDFNPVASDTNPIITLPPLVTLPHCQTEIVTNVSLSSSSPLEDMDCLVAVKFLGPQLSFCRPNSEWINIRIENPCFYSSRVTFSQKDDMFHLLGSGGHMIGSWDLHKHKHTPKLQKLRFQNLPEMTKSRQELLDSCCTSEHLVESRTTGETFLVKWYKKTYKTIKGTVYMRTKAIMVFKLDQEGNAFYTQDIGDLCIYLSKSEPFCVQASSFPTLQPNEVVFYDVDELGSVDLADPYYIKILDGSPAKVTCPFYIPPQNID